MASFKSFIALILLLVLTSCDPLYKTESGIIELKLNRVPVEMIHVDAKGFASIVGVIVTNNDATRNERVMLMRCWEIPDSSQVNALDLLPFDSLIVKNNSNDKCCNWFKRIGMVNIDREGEFIVRVDESIIDSNNYIFGIPSNSEMNVGIRLLYSKMADSTAPTSNIITLNYDIEN